MSIILLKLYRAVTNKTKNKINIFSTFTKQIPIQNQATGGTIVQLSYV